MKNYLDILNNVNQNGKARSGRNGGTKYLFSQKFRHDMSDGFPLLTTKKVNPASVLGELFGFLKGFDKVDQFKEFGCNIWDPWGLGYDVYNVAHRPNEELNVELATKLNITPEEAEALRDEYTTKHKQWAEERAEYLQSTTMRYMDYVNRGGSVTGLAKLVITGSAEDNIATSSDLGDVIAELETEIAAMGEAINWEYLVNRSTKLADIYAAEPKDPIKVNDIDLMFQDVITPKGYLGPIYGKQWIDWKTSTGKSINQIARVADQLSSHTSSRRIVLNAWNPEVIPDDHYPIPPTNDPELDSKLQIEAAIKDGKQALPPCHLMVILDLDVDREACESTLNMYVLMRSTDVPIGLPYNIASYAFLLVMIASQYGYTPGELAIEMVNCHIYSNQLEAIKTQLSRTPGKLPTIKPIPKDIAFDKPDTLTVENMQRVLDCIEGYDPQPFIRIPVSV